MIENKPSSRSNEFLNVSISGNYCMTGLQHMWHSGTTEQGQNKSAHLSTLTPWHKTISCISDITTTILNIWQLMRWLYFSKGRLHSSRISKRNINISELGFTNCATLMATHGTEVYLQKDKKQATEDMTATNATMKQLTRRVKGHGHKL